MLVCGVDDAGRGSIIGPLVIAGVLVDQWEICKLVELGVKDSKLLSPTRRTKLATEIVKIVRNHCIVKLAPSEIDVVVETGSKLYRLNRLEAHAMARVIANLKPDIAYVDASDVLPKRYAEHIAEKVPFQVKIISEHKADRTYPVVSAASIIAKVERDKAIAELNEIFGNIGSGYCSDPKTISFLKNWVRTHGSYPEHVRKSWITAKKILDVNNSFLRSSI
ncbi:ribonuclease HII [Candidatus Bathyarchaeota archaeon]|nr:ribonuclease HII [Candidatus Bathyarchaeota archaeon]